MLDRSQVVASVAGVSVSLDDWLNSLKRRGRLVRLVREAAVVRLVLQRAAEAGLAVTDTELQAAADVVRRRYGLTSAADTNAWLAREGLSLDEFEQNLEADLLAEKFKDHLTRDRIADHFAAHRDRYTRARLRHLVASSEGIARELLAQVVEEGQDFARLARTHSLHGSARAGGDLGSVGRWALAPAAADKVFGARAGDVIGPIAGPEGWHLYLVEELRPAELDDETAAVIRRELFAAWLNEQHRDLRIDLGWLESC